MSLNTNNKNLYNLMILLIKIQIIFLLLFTNIFSSGEYPLLISEINFRGDEYVEIISNSTHNAYFGFDDNYFQTINEKGVNEFLLYSLHPNSSIILIVGENFISNNNQEYLEQLNCTIYQTNRAQVGFRSLRNGGENITIRFSNSTSLSFFPTSTIEYSNELETLHFNTTHNFLDTKSPCELNSFQSELFTPLLSIEENTSNNNLTNGSINSNQTTNSSQVENNETIENNCELTLEVEPVIEDSRIQFTFRGNVSLGVTYYIEDGVGNVVRNPFSSNTASTKSYTPRKNGKFIVYGFIEDERCEERIKVNATTFFYNSLLDIDFDSSSSTNTRVPRVQENTFLQINQVLQEGLNQVRIIGEVSRGNSNAYRFTININKVRVAEFDVKRYGHFDFQIPLQLEAGENTIEIQGFGLRDEVKVTMPDITNDLEDTIILLLHKHGITSHSNSDSQNIRPSSSSSLSSIELEESVRQNSPPNSISNQNVSSQLLEEEQNKSDREGELLFSKHFFHQNVGIITIVGGITLVAGVIIAMR
ncbi:MAG: hypothetical protein LAT82_01770 [Nanoarchaeota archaeon]|nr:hypothetical protein [Nanoarchaeota archaeon]